AVYMFYALAIVCDVYFVSSLEKICENLHLSEDVAGATFMAAGSSAPELFTSLIGVFITKGDVGVGTIVGSAVFNILVIIGVCGIFAGQTISLTWWPLFRDSVYYIISILALILIIYDEKVLWWETLVLISMYGIYILIMKFNGQIWGWVELKCGIPGQPCLVSSLRQDVAPEEASTHCDTSMILMKKEIELKNENGKHCSIFNCLRRQRLIMSRSSGECGSGPGEIPGQESLGMEGATWGLENGDSMDSETQPLEDVRTWGKGGTLEMVEDMGDTQPKEAEEDEEAEEEQPFNPLIVPGKSQYGPHSSLYPA
ncbi:hypothetical protein QTP86_017335, partial [Hemibagrus guttatus]